MITGGIAPFDVSTPLCLLLKLKRPPIRRPKCPNNGSKKAVDSVEIDIRLGLVTELCACQTIETHSGFSCLNCKLSMHIRWDTYHKFAAEMFGGDWLRDRFFIALHVGNNCAHKLADSF